MAGEWVAELLVGRILRTEPASLSRQLYTLLRAAMLDGRLPADTRLPSSRWLAKELGLARNTVLEVYEQLLAEGYLRARRGAGSFVEAGLLRAASAGSARSIAICAMRQRTGWATRRKAACRRCARRWRRIWASRAGCAASPNSC